MQEILPFSLQKHFILQEAGVGGAHQRLMVAAFWPRHRMLKATQYVSHWRTPGSWGAPGPSPSPSWGGRGGVTRKAHGHVSAKGTYATLCSASGAKRAERRCLPAPFC